MMILVVILFLSISFLIFSHRSKKRSSKSPPGPPGLPLIGNLHQLHNHASTIHRHLWLLSKQYGPLMLLHFGMKPTLVVSSARMAKEIMKTHDLVFASRPSLIGQQKLSYNGLDIAFTPYNEYWREMRKLCVIHLFSTRQLKSFSPIREDEVKRMITKISHSASFDIDDDKVVIINLSETLVRFTSSLICRIAFGKKYEEETQRSGFHGLLIETQAVLAEFYFSDYMPWLGWVDRVRGLHTRLDKVLKELDMFYQKVIDDHLNTTQSHQQQDILHILLQLMDAHNSTTPFHLTIDHIKALLMDIFLAGTDTSAATLVWVMTSLMKNPRVMKKAKDEIRGLYGDKDLISEEDIEKLHYLKAVVKETLRLFPPAPLLLPRESMQKCEIEGYEIEAKTHVLVNAWAIGRDPEAWEEPDEFYPERFFKCSRDFKGQDFELIPFGSGRRICPGIHMSVVTLELTLANLLHSFDWKLPHGIHEQDIDTNVIPGLTMHKKNDLCLVAHNHIKS